MKRIVLLAFLTAGLVARAQSPLYQEPKLAGPATGAKPGSVQFLSPDQISLASGKAETVTLHFRIAPGYHINSHTPRDKFLIPTALSLPDGLGVRLESAQYPSGVEYILPADPSTKLDVYTGDFAIQARMVATAGTHPVEAKLRYQACDQAQCLPPKSLIVPLSVTAK